MTAADILFWLVKLWDFWSAVPVVVFLVYHRHKIQSTLSQREDALKALCAIAPNFGLEVEIADDHVTVSDPLAEQIIQAAADTPFVYIEID